VTLTRGAPNRILVAPTHMPVPTPTHTEYTSMLQVKEPLLSFSTVCPTTLRAGSARVAMNPRQNMVPSAIMTPWLYEYA
jgi:hypothetical protein